MIQLKENTQDIMDFDDAVEYGLLSNKYFRKGRQIESMDDFEAEENRKQIKSKSSEFKRQSYKEEKVKKEKSTSIKDPLMYDARTKLNYYLKKIPNYNTTKTQISLIQKEMNEYKKSGDTKNYDACVEMVRTLKEKISEIKSIFSVTEGAKAKEKRLNNLILINESNKIKELKKKEKQIKENIGNFSVNKIVQELSHYRKLLNYDEKNAQEIEDFDNLYDGKVKENWSGYYELLDKITDLTGLTSNDIQTMPLINITEILKENIDSDALNEELRVVRAEIQAEKDNLTGALSLSNIINEIYDVKTEDSKDIDKAKEILASTHIQMVKSIAYGICYGDPSGKNMRYYDDCVSAGLLALTGVINNWIKLQQVYDTNLSFKGWAKVNVTNAIKREFYTQQSGGRISGSRWADLISRENKKIDKFLETYPQYKEFDRDFVKSLALDAFADNKTIASSNDISAIVTQSDIYDGAEDGEGADLWSNIVSDTMNDFDLIEAGSEYEELISSISNLMKKLDKYERKLFMLVYGFEKKLNHIKGETDGKRVTTTYTQKEIGELLWMFYEENGVSSRAKGPLSQPAVNDKIKKLEKKITEEIKNDASLKKGFDYLVTYWLNNTDILNMLSDNRDEIGFKKERDVYYESIDEMDADELSMYDFKLTDGTTLKDKYNISKSNIFADNKVIDDFYRIAEE